MATNNEPDGKNSLLGEFLVALARAPESVQESILLYGIKQMVPYSTTLITPYPMMSHMMSILERKKQSAPNSSNDDSGSNV